MIELGVNIDHVATVRNARGGAHPDPVRAAMAAEAAGADGITAHLREDRRHIRDADMYAIKQAITVPLNFEMAATDEMIDIANGLDVGLTASIWTESLDTAMRLTGKIQAGYVWVNDSSDHYLGAPFGGMKSSGQGREECLEELLAYTEAKTVTIVQKKRP